MAACWSTPIALFNTQVNCELGVLMIHHCLRSSSSNLDTLPAPRRGGPYARFRLHFDKKGKKMMKLSRKYAN